MAEKRNINALLSEADVYRDQGLLKESRAKYIEILEMIKNNKGSSRNIQLIIGAVNKKIGTVENELDEIGHVTEHPALSEQDLNIIKNLSSFSRTRETSKPSTAFHTISITVAPVASSRESTIKSKR